MIYMRSIGATGISESTKKQFRRKLEKEFEDLMKNYKLFVLPKNLSKVQLAAGIQFFQILFVIFMQCFHYIKSF